MSLYEEDTDLHTPVYSASDSDAPQSLQVVGLPTHPFSNSGCSDEKIKYPLYFLSQLVKSWSFLKGMLIHVEALVQLDHQRMIDDGHIESLAV
jgi:hypothetical protein